MDSLKVPKGNTSGGSKSPGSIPMAIRFNAGEESVEDVLKPSESLSSSPQQSEDFSWRKDFLQGSFFHRKRSGSIEGGSSPGSSLISNLSSSEVNTVGTWKLIKGKVSQAMEDIKSSKNVSTQQTIKSDTNNEDSDIETATINSSISDDFSIDPAPKNSTNQTDSDLDIDPNILLTGDDIESSTIHKSLATLRSKNIPQKPTKGPITTTKKLKKDESPSRSSATTSIRSTFLRKRKKQNADKPETIQQPVKVKKDIEIESGVEMLEDMVLPTTSNFNNEIDETNDECFKDALTQIFSIDLDLTITNNKNDIQMTTTIGSGSNVASYTFVDLIKNFLKNIYKSRSILISLTLLTTLLMLPVPEFFRGVIACLFTISLFSSAVEIIKMCIERLNCQNGGPEKTKFQIPDYSTLPICEIPAAEEHKPLKSYSGWMNEINNYDPANYHISMTRPVYIRLDGSILRVSNTTTRIPKRSMWNEQLVDKKNIVFTRNRCFNLLGCRVEMCPRGLARKRHFSRKYPIQLIVKNSETIRMDDEQSVKYKRHSTPSEYVEKTSIQSTSGCEQQNDDPLGITHQSSNESNEDRSEKAYLNDIQNDMDFGATILNADLQKLQDTQEIAGGKENVPCGDETRILLFARCDREKEDWYRRFCAASIGAINDQELHIPDIVMITEDDIKAASDQIEETTVSADDKVIPSITDSKPVEDTTTFEGLLMTTDAARNPAEYIRFMSKYQKACTQKNIPVIKSVGSPNSTSTTTTTDNLKRNRRKKKQEDELWKGIDQSLYLGPSGSVVWANVLVGRVLFSCLNDATLLEKIQEFLQKKLSAIRLPSFMEDVVIAQVYLGDTPPLIHRVSQPLLDERGTWIDADLTYEGLMHMTITTKLNLLRLKRQQNSAAAAAASTLSNNLSTDNGNLINETTTTETNCAIYDSNAESSGGSSSESESPTLGTIDPSTESQQQTFYTTPGSSRRILRIVDRITASNLFQSATEISYIQRAMENMSTKITLRVELKGLVSRIVINLPPPPSDRIWIAFRGPPRLWISAKPAVGDHTFDWSIVTNVIESKLCEEVYKYLVYPNMVDIIAPFLGQSTYKE